ncbi:MAG: polysaccharide deacetylase family protein [Pseudomonadota bacterium]
MSQVPILMYHAIEDAQHPSAYTDRGDRVYAIQAEMFREQISYLREHDFTVVTLQTLIGLQSLPARAVVLTFDDGHASDCQLALPILQEAGFHADFFITTGLTDQSHYLSTEEIRKLAEANMGIGSHSVSHRYMDDLSPEEVKAELRDSRDALQSISHKPVTTFSAPGGRLHNALSSIAQELGYDTICNSKFGLYKPGVSAFDIPRVALKNTMTMDVFKKIVHRDTRFMLRKQLGTSALTTAKKVLGTRGYEAIRSRLLKQ